MSDARVEIERLKRDVVWLTRKADDERNGRLAAEAEVSRLRERLAEAEKLAADESASADEMTKNALRESRRAELAEAGAATLRERIGELEKERDLAIKQLTPVMEALDSVSDKLEATQAELEILVADKERKPMTDSIREGSK